ncbi:hypothetical protein A7982_12445 [Minicystis rosea]|nr:hypothetical protein A7982_12445 [Minicystis rosea]
MTGALFLAPALVLGVACTMLAWAHVRRVTGAVRGDLEALSLALKRVPAGERAQALLDRTEAGSWEHDLAADILTTSNDDAKVSMVNLALADLAHVLERSDRWPATALRIALLGGGVLAFLAFITEPDRLRWPLTIAAISGLAALIAAQARRTGVLHAERQRRAVDALVTATLALPPEAHPPSPVRGGPSAPRRRHRAGS